MKYYSLLYVPISSTHVPVWLRALLLSLSLQSAFDPLSSDRLGVGNIVRDGHPRPRLSRCIQDTKLHMHSLLKCLRTPGALSGYFYLSLSF